MTFLEKIRARIVGHFSGGVEVKDIRKYLDSLVSENRNYALKHLPAHMLKANQLEQFYQWLTDFDFIEAKVFHPEIPIQALIEDYNLDLDFENSFSSQQAGVLKLIQGALQLSAHVLNEDKMQLAEQLLGRLLSFEKPEIQKLLQQAQQSKNICLVPQTPSLTPPGGALVRTLAVLQTPILIPPGAAFVSIWKIHRSHSRFVNAVAITSDNKYAISASEDKTLKVWDWQTGEEIRTLTGHSDSVNAVAITSDNKYAISASEDKTLIVWYLQTGEVIASFTGESAMICCAVASDGVRIIAGEASGRIHFLQLKGVEKSQKLKIHDQNNLLKYQDVGDDYEAAATYHQLGKTAHLEKRFEKAQVYYQKALLIYETACDYKSAADDYYNLGLIAKQQERFEEAISYFVKALNIFKDIYDTEKHRSTVRQLGKIYKILGEYLFQVTYREVMGEKCPKQLFSAIQALSQAN